MQSMAGTDHKKEQIKAAYVEQAEILHLKVTIMTGWPNEKRECTVAIESYWNFWDEMTVLNGLILKGDL